MKKDLEEARAILYEIEDVDEEEDLGEPEWSFHPSPITKVVLGTTAVIFSPVVTGLLFLFLLRESPIVRCPNCGIDLQLDNIEVKQGWFSCVDCGKTVAIE